MRRLHTFILITVIAIFGFTSAAMAGGGGTTEECTSEQKKLVTLQAVHYIDLAKGDDVLGVALFVEGANGKIDGGDDVTVMAELPTDVDEADFELTCKNSGDPSVQGSLKYFYGCVVPPAKAALASKFRLKFTAVMKNGDSCAYRKVVDFADAMETGPLDLEAKLCAYESNGCTKAFCIIADALTKAIAITAIDSIHSIDGDDIPAGQDDCPFAFGTTCSEDDVDGDGVKNDDDNSPFQANEDQTDTDDDGKGDATDNDDDGDGKKDLEDNCPLVKNADQEDVDDDDIGDACDDAIECSSQQILLKTCCKDSKVYDSKNKACVKLVDTDGDGFFDNEDNCPTVFDVTNNCGSTPKTLTPPFIPPVNTGNDGNGGGGCSIQVNTKTIQLTTFGFYTFMLALALGLMRRRDRG